MHFLNFAGNFTSDFLYTISTKKLPVPMIFQKSLAEYFADI